MSILDRGKAALAVLMDGRSGGGSPRAGDGASIVQATAGYMKGGISPFFRNWLPAMRDTGENIRVAWGDATARATDLVQNSGWISGGIEAACGAVLGPGLRLNATPDTTVIDFAGLTDDAGNAIDAEGWARFVERRFEAWSNDPRECDARGRQTLADITRSQFKLWHSTGEMLAALPHREEAGVLSSIKVLSLPPWRLSEKTNALERISHGIRLDTWGRPIGYLFRSTNNLGITTETEFQARDDAGRPQIVHVFEGDPTQTRGITPLVTALHTCRQFDQLANAQLLAALIQTIFAATVETDAPTEALLAGLTNPLEQGLGAGNLENYVAARMGWHEETQIDLGEHGKIAHLFPGEKLKFNSSEHPNSTYEKFARFLLLEIARGCGLTFSQLTGDYTGITYTGVRMQTADSWQTTVHRRKNIAGRFLQPIYEAWLEEEIETGRIKFPGGIVGFGRLRSAATRANWRGPAKPQADDLKTAKTLATYREMGVMSDGQIANEIGDLEIGDVYAERAREANLRKKLGLGDVGPSTTLAATLAAAENDDEPSGEEPGTEPAEEAA